MTPCDEPVPAARQLYPNVVVVFSFKTIMILIPEYFYYLFSSKHQILNDLVYEHIIPSMWC